MTPLPPARNRNSFECPRCGAFASQAWESLMHVIDQHEDNPWIREVDTEKEVSVTARIFAANANVWGDDDPRRSWCSRATWATSQCFSCNQSAVWMDDAIVYPRASTVPPPNPDMPEKPRALYLEAAAVAAVSRRAGAAMARATLERLLKELDPFESPKRPMLDDRILHVEPRISSDLIGAMTIVRHVGNKALHVEDAPDDALVLVLDDEDSTHVEVLFSIVNDLVDELVTKPARRQAFLAAVPRDVLDQVDTKRAKAAKRAPTEPAGEEPPSV